ncbi:MAG: hypothetical protein AAF581_04125 [Planctomycetota bacterium]
MTLGSRASQVLAVAGNTAVEATRQPIYVTMLLLVLFLTALSPALSAFTFEDDNKLLVDIGLSTIFVGGLFLAAFTATGVVHDEIERKTVLTVVSKPVDRLTFIVGKYLGVLAASAIAHWCWSLAFLLAVRHRVLARMNDTFDEPVLVFGIGSALLALALASLWNFLRRREFGSTLAKFLAVLLPIGTLLTFSLDKQWQWQSPFGDLSMPLTWALLLLFEAEAILCAIAVATSTRLRRAMTLSVCGGAFVLGITSDYFFGRHIEESFLARIAYAVTPNLQYHWLADALTQGRTIDAGYVGLVTAYSAFVVLALLAVAAMLFRDREVG